MGMGGSGPFEALAHGGAPIAVFDDEQVFRAKSNLPWADAEMIPDRGIQGFEKKLLDLINKGKARAEQLSEATPRGWMNPAVFDVDGKETVVRRGLDGIRDYLKLRGVSTLKSDNYDTLDDALRNLAEAKANRAQQAALTLGDITAGRSNFKDLLIKQLTNARGSAVRSGTGKLGIAAGALTGGGLLLSNLLGGKPSSNEPINLKLQKTAAEDKGNVVAAAVPGALTALMGAGIYDTANELGKIKNISRPYVGAVNDYLKKYPDLMYDVDPVRMRKFLGVMDQYADAAKQMSNLRVVGIPAHVITKQFPLANLMSAPKSTLLNAFGLSSLVEPRELWKVRDNQVHYEQAAKVPRSLLAREMLGHVAQTQLKLSPEVSRVMGADEAARIVNAPDRVSLLERFEPYIKRVEQGLVKGDTFDVNSPFFFREKRMVRGLSDWHPDPSAMTSKALRKLTQTEGMKGYALLLSRIASGAKPGMKLLGAALGLGGLGAAGLGIHDTLKQSG